MLWLSKPIPLLLGCRIQKLGRLPYQAPPGHLPRSAPNHACWNLGTTRPIVLVLLLPNRQPTGFPLQVFLFILLFPIYWPLFPHIMNVAARVCRSPDSRAWTDHTQVSLPHSPTPPECSTRANLALINNLGIVYHQYCSSSNRGGRSKISVTDCLGIKCLGWPTNEKFDVTIHERSFGIFEWLPIRLLRGRSDRI